MPASYAEPSSDDDDEDEELIAAMVKIESQRGISAVLHRLT